MVVPTRVLAQVAVADIEAVAVSVLEDAGRFAGTRFDLAGDQLTRNEAMGILSRVTGRSFSYYQVSLDVVSQRMGEDAVKMYESFDRVGYAVDRAVLHREVQLDSYGGIDVLEVRDVPRPFPERVRFWSRSGQPEENMSNSISTLLIRNLAEVFRENDPAPPRSH